MTIRLFWIAFFAIFGAWFIHALYFCYQTETDLTTEEIWGSDGCIQTTLFGGA
jgi:hypothetical protein